MINKIFLFAVLQTWPKIFCLFFLSQTICIKKGPYTTYPNSYWRKTLYLWILLLYRKFARKFDQTYHQTSQWNFQICIEFQILINLIFLLQYYKLGPNSFACSTCSKQFKTKKDLRRHIRIHTGQKPFSCNYCDYASTQSGNLNTHIVRYHNETLESV